MEYIYYLRSISHIPHIDLGRVLRLDLKGNDEKFSLYKGSLALE